MALLEVNDLRTHFFTREGTVRAVDGISFHVDAGESGGSLPVGGCLGGELGDGEEEGESAEHHHYYE